MNPSPRQLALLAAGTFFSGTAVFGDCIESYDFIRQTDNPDQRFVRTSLRVSKWITDYMLPAETGFDEPEPELDPAIYCKSIGYDPDTYRIELVGDAGHRTQDLKIRIDVYRDGQKLPPEEYAPEEFGFVDGVVPDNFLKCRRFAPPNIFDWSATQWTMRLAARKRFR